MLQLVVEARPKPCRGLSSTSPRYVGEVSNDDEQRVSLCTGAEKSHDCGRFVLQAHHGRPQRQTSVPLRPSLDVAKFRFASLCEPFLDRYFPEIIHGNLKFSTGKMYFL